MLEFRTQGVNGHAVKYSPFYDSRLAVAAAANFGLVGNGRLCILGLTARGIVGEKQFETQDALYDLAWSEVHENQLVVAAGDGSVKLFDTTLDRFPVQSWQEHKREVFAVSWNLVAKDTFCSSSWDGCIKIYSPQREDSLRTLPVGSCTYSVAWSPHSPSILSCVSSDSKLRVFDLRTPSSAAFHLVQTLPLHGSLGPLPATSALPAPAAAEALTHDWNKYRDTVVAAAGVDCVIRTFDLRAPSQGPQSIFSGHQYAVRKVAWSPHQADLLLSASYDMSCRLWRDHQPPTSAMVTTGTHEVGRMDRHTEFVMGVDWCLFGADGWCASCAWDERVLVWDARAFMKPQGP